MRIALNILGGLLVLFGSVWALQGLNILPARMMAGQTQWVVYGVLALAAGILLLAWVNRRRR